MDVNIDDVGNNDSRDTGAAEALQEVSVTRKRRNEKEESMDTDDGAKRPSFPPVNAENTVRLLILFYNIAINYMQQCIYLAIRCHVIKLSLMVSNELFLEEQAKALISLIEQW